MPAQAKAPRPGIQPGRGAFAKSLLLPFFFDLEQSPQQPGKAFGAFEHDDLHGASPFVFCVRPVTPFYPFPAPFVQHGGKKRPPGRKKPGGAKAHLGETTTSRLPACTLTSAPPGRVSLLAPRVEAGTRQAFCSEYLAPRTVTPSAAPSSGKREK